MLKLMNGFAMSLRSYPAAFRRLCVETKTAVWIAPNVSNQPPSGGCVLKPLTVFVFIYFAAQPPSGGCVLKRDCLYVRPRQAVQPPSGGCVLKPNVMPQG